MEVDDFTYKQIEKTNMAFMPKNEVVISNNSQYEYLYLPVLDNFSVNLDIEFNSEREYEKELARLAQFGNDFEFHTVVVCDLNSLTIKYTVNNESRIIKYRIICE